MPRTYTIDREPLDYCRHCYPSLRREEIIRHGSDADTDAPHPEYGGCDYKCDECGDLLTDEDN